MADLQLVVAAGLFSLGGVTLGALLTPLTQLYLERKREQRARDRAKQLIGGELLHAQMGLRTISELKKWPDVEDVNALLPTSAWQENRSSLAGNVDKDLWNQLVLTYACLENYRGTKPSAEVSEGIKQFSYDLGTLRRKLGVGGGWLDEIHEEFKPKMNDLNDSFKRWLDGLSDDDLKKDRVVAKVKQVARDLEEMNQEIGVNGIRSVEIEDKIKRRLNVGSHEK